MTYFYKELPNIFLFVYHFLYTTPFIFVKNLVYNSYNKRWESEFDNIVSKKDEIKDLNLNQLKLEVRATYKKTRK